MGLIDDKTRHAPDTIMKSLYCGPEKPTPLAFLWTQTNSWIKTRVLPCQLKSNCNAIFYLLSMYPNNYLTESASAGVHGTDTVRLRSAVSNSYKIVCLINSNPHI